MSKKQPSSSEVANWTVDQLEEYLINRSNTLTKSIHANIEVMSSPSVAKSIYDKNKMESDEAAIEMALITGCLNLLKEIKERV